MTLDRSEPEQAFRNLRPARYVVCLVLPNGATVFCRLWTWMAVLDQSTPLWWSHLSPISRSTTSAFR